MRFLGGALLLLLGAMLLPWAGYEADGAFSGLGCSGDQAKASYHLFHATRTLVGDAPCPIFHIPYTLDSEDGRAGISSLRAGGAFIVAGAVATLSGMVLPVARPKILAPLQALLPALLVATGAGLMHAGTLAKAAVEKVGPTGDLVQDPGAFGAGPGLWLAYGAAVVLLAATTQRIRTLRAAPAPVPMAPATPADRPVTPAPAATAVDDTTPPAPTDAPRNLTCPRCKHRFPLPVGAPVCPACGYSRAASIK